MSSLKRVQFLITLLLSLLLARVQSKRLILPRFESYPPAKLYVDQEQVASPEKFKIQIEVVIGRNLTVVELLRRQKSKNLTQLPDLTRCKIVQLSREQGFSELSYRALYEAHLSLLESIIDQPLHWVVRNDLGTLTGDEFRIVKREIEPFPLASNEIFDFQLGNVGVVSCVLPHSRPSPPQMVFYHNETRIDTSSNRYKIVYIGKGLGGRVVLLIHSLQYKDTGQYKCQAVLGNQVRKTDKLTHLYINTPTRPKKPNFGFSSHMPLDDPNEPAQITVVEGESLTLYCIFESTPVTTVKWFYSDIKTKPHIKIDNKFGTIQFTNIKLEDSKMYTCLPEGEDNSVSRTFNVNVLKRTKIKVGPENVKLTKLGNSARLQCELDYEAGHSPTKPNWFINGVLIDPLKNKQFQITESNLIIPSVSRELLGIYQCWTVYNNEAWISSMATLTLQSDPIVKDLNPNSNFPQAERVDPNINHHFICSLADIDTKESTEVKWYRGVHNRLIKPNPTKYAINRNMGDKMVILTVLNTEPEIDDGLYICKIYSSRDGELVAEKTFNIVVTNKDARENLPPKSPKSPKSDSIEVKPDQVETVTSSPDQNIESNEMPIARQIKPFLLMISLNWTHVKEFRGIDHYRIEISAAKMSSSKVSRIARSVGEQSDDFEILPVVRRPITDKFFTVTERMGLQPGRIYKFRILGITVGSKRESIKTAWSKPVSLKHMIEEYLVIKEMRYLSAASLVVFWEWAKLKESSLVTQYKVLYREVTSSNRNQRDKWFSPNVNSIIVVGSSTQSVEISGLQTGKEYEAAIYGLCTDASEDKILYTKLSEGVTLKLVKEAIKAEPPVNNNEITPSYIDKSDAKSLNTDDTGFISQEQHRILFLVLGSLSGVFLVVFLVLMSIFIWEKLKRHRKRREGRPIYVAPTVDSHHYSRDPALLTAAQANSGQFTGTLKRKGFPGDPDAAVTNVGHFGVVPNVGNGLAPNQRQLLLQQHHFTGTMPTGVPARNFDPSGYHPYFMEIQNDQASSLYSQVGSESRFSSNALHLTGGNNENYCKQAEPATSESFNFRTLPTGFTLVGAPDRDGIVYQPPFERMVAPDMMESYISHADIPPAYPYPSANLPRLTAHSNNVHQQFYHQPASYPHNAAERGERVNDTLHSENNQNDMVPTDDLLNDVPVHKTSNNLSRPAHLSLPPAHVNSRSKKSGTGKRSGKRSSSSDKKSTHSRSVGQEEPTRQKEELIPLFGSRDNSSNRKPTGDKDSGVKSDEDATSSLDSHGSSSIPHNNNNKFDQEKTKQALSGSHYNAECNETLLDSC